MRPGRDQHLLGVVIGAVIAVVLGAALIGCGSSPVVDASPGDLRKAEASPRDARADLALDARRSDGISTGCPGQNPVVGSVCQGSQMCGYGSTECGEVLECLDGAWVIVSQANPNCGISGSCPATLPSGTCTTGGSVVCTYTQAGPTVCMCLSICSGVRPPPPGTTWQCGKPQTAACPETTPTDGSACPREGLTCSYGNCGGATATCVGGQWKVTVIPPPP
jgi:hypothetical protein